LPIRWRLTLFNALAIGVILLVLGIGLYVLVRDTLLSNTENTVRQAAVSVAKTIRSGGTLEESNRERLTLEGVFVVVRDGQGKVVGETLRLGVQGGAQDGVWRRAARSGNPASGTANLSNQAPDYVYAVPVRLKGSGALRIVEAGKPYQGAQETLEDFSAVLAAGIGAAFLLSIAGAYILARAALKPVDRVVVAAREMGEGDLAKRLPVANPKDEIGRLTTTINALLARLEAAFARREEALARQRRFAADASHELRTPLTSISGYARMLDEWALKDPETAREAVRAIREESGRMRSLVESLLALTRGDEGAPLNLGRHDLTSIASEATDAARASAQGKVEVEFRPPQGPVEANCDRERILQAASILLDNAVKYTPEGGRISVEVGRRGGSPFLSVTDTGIGIPEDELPMIFERFHRVDPSRGAGGAGLGLSIARQIAETHGGTIEVESRVGEGSTFTLLLPEDLPSGGGTRADLL